ncbi:cytochrome P450, partial [Escherichia coli]|nr:cytochrome P450 [Escherichia coli]
KRELGTSSATKDDVLDALLNLSQQHNGKIEMDKNEIEHLLLNIFVAGTDTTTYTLEWAMAELIHYPAIMSKVEKELEQVIGKGKPVEETDIGRLPYLQAVIKETFRLHPPVPLLLPRRAEVEVEIGGYTIPK